MSNTEFFMTFLLLRPRPLLIDDTIGAKQYQLRHLKADPLRGFEVDDEFDAVGELHGQLLRRSSRQNLVGQPRGLSPLSVLVGAIMDWALQSIEVREPAYEFDQRIA